ncbi:MAG: hypothetical protein QOJ64_2207 [Acidobacteriota bacterium]|jgi:hypothetical protein|nr:hypothetical protein [Acidobacteriota bacterium]
MGKSVKANTGISHLSLDLRIEALVKYTKRRRPQRQTRLEEPARRFQRVGLRPVP